MTTSTDSGTGSSVPVFKPVKFPLRLGLAWLLALPFAANAHNGKHSETSPGNAIPVEAQPAIKVVEQFSTALQAGDLKRAGDLLADNVLILESGGAERSRAEYLAGHAGHDAEFLKSAHIRVLRRTARADGATAWVGTESELHAGKDGKPMTLLSTETMLLKRGTEGWRIVHIHWSSRPKR